MPGEGSGVGSFSLFGTRGESVTRKRCGPFFFFGPSSPSTAKGSGVRGRPQTRPGFRKWLRFRVGAASLPAQREEVGSPGASKGTSGSAQRRFRIQEPCSHTPHALLFAVMEEGDNAEKGESQGTSKAKVRDVSCITFSCFLLGGSFHPSPHLTPLCMVVMVLALGHRGLLLSFLSAPGCQFF